MVYGRSVKLVRGASRGIQSEWIREVFNSFMPYSTHQEHALYTPSRRIPLCKAIFNLVSASLDR